MTVRWRRFVGRTVRLHLPERTVEGVLTHVSHELLILRGASLLQSAGESVQLDGELLVPRENIDFGQVS